MATNYPKPRLADHGALIRQAIELKGLTPKQVAGQLGLTDKTGSTVWNWVTGRNSPSPGYRDKLAKLLDLDVSEIAPDGAGKPGRKKVKPGPGPAAQAVALYAQHAEVHAPVLAPPRAAPAADLFAATIRADGTMRLKLDLVLDLAKGMALTQTLFAAGVLLSHDKNEATPHDVVEGQS
jgi:transcriptional regulator with XRE-family HTH domain